MLILLHLFGRVYTGVLCVRLISHNAKKVEELVASNAANAEDVCMQILHQHCDYGHHRLLEAAWILRLSPHDRNEFQKTTRSSSRLPA